MNAQQHLLDVAIRHRVPRRLLTGACKFREVTTARSELYFRLVIIRGLTLTQAGTVTRKDHTTVLYGLRRYAARTFGTPAKASLATIRTAAKEIAA